MGSIEQRPGPVGRVRAASRLVGICGGALILASTLVAGPLRAGVASAAPSGPFVTLLIGRSLWAQSEGGSVVAGQPTLIDIAQLLAARGVRATGVVVPGHTLEKGILNYNGNLYPSWQELATLRDQYGWSFVSNGQNRVDITSLSPTQQIAESCGSLDAFEDHGQLRAWGMYGPGSNRITDAIATNVVGKCFAFTRLYWGSNLNNRAAVSQPPYYAHTDDTSGGTCNQAPCSGNGSGDRYMLPTKLSQDLQAAGPDQWVLLSTYKLVTGSKLSGNRRWDCRATDPRKHWTTELESYCLVDLLTALDSIKPGSVVTDPAGVAEAWGRVPGNTPPSTTTTTTSTTTTTTSVPQGTALNTTVSSPASGARVSSPVRFAGNATADRGVATVRIAVRDQVTKLWFQPNGSFGAYTQFDASLGTPGATSTTWNRSLTLPPGSYGVSARAADTAGAVDSTDAWVTFTVA